METLRPTIRSFLASAILTICSSALAQTTLYVNGTCGNDAWSGTSMICDAPDGPKETIQAAIAAAVAGDEVVVAPGTYNELVNFIGKAIALRSSDGPEVTILDGTGLNDSVVKCISGEGPETVLEGFTITGGMGDPSVNNAGTVGGGMRNEGSSPTISTCMFIGNAVSGDDNYFGGGMFNRFSNPTVLDCVFEANQALAGGGIFNISSSPEVRNCLFANHSMANGGAMVNSSDSFPMITSCTFRNNSTTGGGGAIVNNNAASATVVNSLFLNNTSAFQGGAILNADASSTTVISSTFANNSAPPSEGGAIRSRNSFTHATISNSVFWNNSSQVDGPATVTYSDVQNGHEGVGNIDADPLFANPAAGNYRLRQGSPCADAADNTSVPAGVTTDLDGNPRFVDSCASDTGNGDGENPLVDMGAYETPACRVDLTYDCTVNTQDFLVFLGLWVLQDPIADWDASGTVNTLDFLGYLNDWVAGC